MVNPKKIGKYQIKRFLGNGQFGKVFLAFDPLLSIDRALKIIEINRPNEFVDAIKESQTLEKCRHKHIVDIKDVNVELVEKKTVVCIVMEYLSRGSVQNQIENRFISVQEACKIITESLLGLEHAHNISILHRDIKPGNLLLGENGEAKLSDFGLALDYQIEPLDIKGYKPHIPPEVILGSDQDKSSDIYAMGMTFYRLLNNVDKLTFNFLTTEEWIEAIRKEKYPSRLLNQHIPLKIVRILKKSINKDKDKRYSNCFEFRQAIDKISFNIDWRRFNKNLWIGISGKNKFQLEKIEKRNVWQIDFKRNERRVSRFCYTGLNKKEASKKFYDIIKTTTVN